MIETTTDTAQVRASLARATGLARLALNAVKSRREYADGRLHVDAADIADVLNAIAHQGRDARQLHQFDHPAFGMEWAHLWSTAALLDAEGMRWLEVHDSNPPEHDLAAAEVALEHLIETSDRIDAKLRDHAAAGAH